MVVLLLFARLKCDYESVYKLVGSDCYCGFCGVCGRVLVLCDVVWLLICWVS